MYSPREQGSVSQRCGGAAFKETAIKVKGDGFGGRYVKPSAQAAFVKRTEGAIRAATRFKTIRFSSVKGRPEKFLSQAWDIEQAPWTATEAGDTLLVFRAPTLGEAAPELFQQGVLFEDVMLQEDWTVFDLLGQVLSDVGSSEQAATRLDYGMLWRLQQYQSDIRKGLESATFTYRGGSDGTARIDEPMVHRATDLLGSTPGPRRVRLVGKLDMLKLSDSLFQLQMADGKSVRGIWDLSRMDLKPLIGEDVLIEGTATFRASGQIAGVQAEAARRATEADQAFRVTPENRASELLIRTAQREAGAFARIVGEWPGDESQEEIDEFLRQIS